MSFNGHGHLGYRAEQAISALVASKTVRQAAASVNISERTLLRWLKLPEFQSRLRKARNEVLEAALEELKILTAEAVKILRDALRSENEFLRVKAATIVIDRGLKTIEMQDLEERVIALEQERPYERT
jgi:hypothetical protein